ncbi:sigma-70 family RNA polymerase sigma factor [Kitasatospora sp. MAP5-34]|uniref:sigma-70 family RNA polymerase sigma factor n=1 Tax=Kitasatospora sp. MAP5-34 TaxID=3035102 RepID=UPI002472EBC2|nr:sigma-70 family RNA polymerase sigma factor [Kitasatospora sp. MAP5-34]MDH6577903.1 RNA polymerase sigma factor (sigma-70 family) [Kitasatospora sp. MAP5-34]
MDRDCGAATVIRAQTGDQHATNELIGGHLPLVYNIVGRALGGHPDTDDVVQETMLRAVDNLPSLREPASFRSWLVAIAMNQIRRRHQDRQAQQIQQSAQPDVHEPADPGSDFVGLTILRLGLSGQRRETAEATRWLDENDRELLALWWLEAAGELTRPELAMAMELAPQHAAVRVQRMKTQLETARAVVRALSAVPRCPELTELTVSWDGTPGALWRKRIARHARECAHCSRLWEDLVPAEGLLAGLALVPLPRAHAAAQAAQAAQAATRVAGHSRASGGHRARSGGPGRRRRPRPRNRVLTAMLGTAVLTVAAAGVVMAEQEPPSAPTTRADAVAVLSPVSPTPTVASPRPASPSAPAPVATTSTPPAAPSSAPATPSPARPSASPTARTRTQSPSSAPATTSVPVPGPAAAVGVVQQVLDLVNNQRSQAGCGPVRANSQLQAAAQGQSDDMAARHFFDHTNPDGQGPQARIEAAGYHWSTWGENIAQGQSDAAAVMDAWMHSPGHRANILNCAFTELGVGVHEGTGGPWWTQDFGAPS